MFEVLLITFIILAPAGFFFWFILANTLDVPGSDLILKITEMEQNKSAYLSNYFIGVRYYGRRVTLYGDGYSWHEYPSGKKFAGETLLYSKLKTIEETNKEKNRKELFKNVKPSWGATNENL